jgi:superfamily II DNA helicase RecQ
MKNKIIPPTLVSGQENHSFKIYNKYSIYFAYKTSHPSQIKIISHLLKFLVDKQNALFKSPTDMGKSLAFFL